MEKKTFLKGAAILGIAGLLVQVLGAFFRIPLANIIGPAGMGYYQTAYPIYVFLLVFSTNGAPAAISKMTSERLAMGNPWEAHRVFKLSFILMAVMGALAFSGIYFGAEKIVSAFGDPGAVMAMKAIAPALLVVPVMSVYRGYFQGMQDMTPTATSQLIEQAVRVAAGLALAVVLMKKGIEYAAAGATFGTSIGPIAGLAVLAIIYGLKRKTILSRITEDHRKEEEPARDIIKALLWIAVPITIGVSILPIINLGDLFIVMKRLESTGFELHQANILYGQLTGMAGPIINIPMALALSMALSMVPAVAAAKASGDKHFMETNIKLGLRTAMIVGVPCSFGLIILAEPIMTLLYPMEMESAAGASGCLSYLAMGVIFLCIGQTMAGILQGLGRPGIAVAGLFAGFIVKLVSTYFLTGFPELNVEGAAIGSTLGFITIGLFNFYSVKKLTGIRFDRELSVFRPVLSGIVMFISCGIIYRIFNGIIGNSLSCILAICIGAAAYGIMLIKSKAISGDEIRMLPKGQKLHSLLKKVRLVE